MSEPVVLDQSAVDRLGRIGGPALVRQMIELFIEHGPARVEALMAGVAGADASRVERAAHTLKSTAGNVGAARMQKAAETLEALAGQGEIDADAASRMGQAWIATEAALRRTLEELDP